MLYLAATTDKLQLVTSAAVNLDVQANYVDAAISTGAVSGIGRQNTAITTATTTDVLAAPGSSTARTLKQMTARNKSAGAVDVTVLFNQNGTTFEVHKVTLNGGDCLEYIEGVGFFILANTTLATVQASTSDQSANAADTYIAGSSFELGSNIKVGSYITWALVATKTAAGTATPTYNIRFGTAGTTADTARITLTGPAQTAATDTATIYITCIIRGPIGASCVVHGEVDLHHNSATTGFANVNHYVGETTSASFDITPTGTRIGLSINPGASGNWTIKECVAAINR